MTKPSHQDKSRLKTLSQHSETVAPKKKFSLENRYKQIQVNPFPAKKADSTFVSPKGTFSPMHQMTQQDAVNLILNSRNAKQQSLSH